LSSLGEPAEPRRLIDLPSSETSWKNLSHHQKNKNTNKQTKSLLFDGWKEDQRDHQEAAETKHQKEEVDNFPLGL